MSYLEMEAYRDGASETDFMEEAGSGVALVVHDFIERYGIGRHIALLCGKGHNAGDAYVAGIHLLHLEYSVQAFQITPLAEASDLTRKNAQRFVTDGGTLIEVNTEEDLNFPEQGLILDGIFGTGFRGEVKEPFSWVIQAANDSGLMIIAIDIPSGLDGDTGIASATTIKATETAYLGLPKLGFFLNEGWDCVGYLRYVDFGLPQEYIEEIAEDFVLLTPDILVSMLPKIVRTRNKYEAGLVVGLAGSPGMPGAALLASTAALRGGAGIVKLLHPLEMQHELGSVPLELVKMAYDPTHSEKTLSEEILSRLNAASAVFIGPGLGKSKPTRDLLKKIIPKLKVPSVLDADALDIIAEEEIEIPKNAVLTPHRGELSKLLNLPKEDKISLEFLKICQAWVEEKGVTLVIKGGPSFILHPHATIHVSAAGDPGMATAGTGDVLTGLIASLLAQKCEPFDAARLGVYLHGLAGEHAAQEKTSFCLIASDLIDQFPAAFAFEAS